MKKSIELTHPDSCLNKARDDEMLFVLLDRDAAAPATIRFWCQQRVRMGLNNHFDPQILEALRCASYMEENRGGKKAHSVEFGYGLRMTVGKDGVWLHFEASDGKCAGVHVYNTLAADKDAGIIRDAITQWVADREQQAGINHK